mgnify:CR=1 FL=1
MILAIIQARTGSTRLPGKVLLKIKGKTVINHVVDRVSASLFVDYVVVATTLLHQDIKLVSECAKLGVRVYCGSEQDVLDRYYQVSKILAPDHIVRITADCPVIDPKVIDLVVKKHLETDADYTSNTLDVPFPDGQDVEVFKMSALELAWNNATLASEREHVTPFIKLDEEAFKVTKVLAKKYHSEMRWTLDEKEDFELILILFERLYDLDPLFTMEDILNVFSKDKNLSSVNSMYLREEGYRKSLRNDYVINLDGMEI